MCVPSSPLRRPQCGDVLFLVSGLGFCCLFLFFFFLWSSGFHAVKVSKPCRVLLKYARQDAEAYRLQYNEVIPVAQLVRKVAAVMQEFTRALSLV